MRNCTRPTHCSSHGLVDNKKDDNAGDNEEARPKVLQAVAMGVSMPCHEGHKHCAIASAASGQWVDGVGWGGGGRREGTVAVIGVVVVVVVAVVAVAVIVNVASVVVAAHLVRDDVQKYIPQQTAHSERHSHFQDRWPT